MIDLSNKKAIVLPMHGKPIIIKYGDRHNYINKMTNGRSVYWLDQFGYKLAVICNDMRDEGINNLASVIGKTEICGNCILVDDDKDLDINELKKIIQLGKEFININGRVCRNIEEYQESEKQFRELLQGWKKNDKFKRI